MKQKLVGGLLAVVLIPILGTPSSRAEQPQAEDSSTEANRQVTTTLVSPQLQTQRVEVVKVGEYQYQAKAEVERDPIAKVGIHEWAGRRAATLYVRNIPVLTFLAANSDSSSSGSANNPNHHGVKVASNPATSTQPSDATTAVETADARRTEQDPLWRATEVAAKINQLFLNSIDAKSIGVRWEAGNRHLISINSEELVEIGEQTILPDTTGDAGQDALQATNRLRRLLGNAPPLEEIAGKPKPEPSPLIAIGPIQVRFNGWASWYGPGFHGNLSASGEPFDQNALTAAHRELPFGTLVLVTNLDNGRSVVVRINDRGPYIGDRMIDLSAAAASMLGMMNSGVAPVQLDVLDPQQARNLQQ